MSPADNNNQESWSSAFLVGIWVALVFMMAAVLKSAFVLMEIRNLLKAR